LISVRFHRGLELPDHGLWLDPWERKPFAFVSHAHSDHIGNHAEAILSAPTAKLMRARLAGKRIEHVLAFGVTREVRGLRLTLLPAGHIFGSAQLYLEENGESLLYTGDFKLRPSLSAERVEWRQADTLIMETTFGLPKYLFPPAEEVMANVVRFCAECLEAGYTPVLLGYSLGKSQEVLCALARAGLRPMLHTTIFKMTEIYRELQPGFPCEYEKYEANEVAGKVLICPPSASRTAMLTSIKNRRTAVLTGWAIEPGAKFRYGCDEAFPLSDHADYAELLRYVGLVKPKRVLTLHGFASEFAADLRRRGVEGWALTGENQLELQLGDMAMDGR
jgi:Cft2 family RNA processing exonuclease